MIDQEKFDEMKELIGGEFEAFIQLFLSELQKDIDIIINTKDVKIIKLKAHSQKSSCALLGAVQLSNIFLQIEQLASQNKETQILVDQLPELFLQFKKGIL